MSTTLSTLGVLDPFVPSPVEPWNRARVQHLYLRLGFGADLATVNAGLAMEPSALVDQLIDNILAQGEPDAPFWANWSNQDYIDSGDVDMEMYFQHKYELRVRWTREMITEGLRSKMALFWHNHFVTEEEVYFCNSSMWAYYAILHTQAMGNFRTFVEQMGKNPAMLVYLNGNQNVAEEPNENYARELLELFTLGESNGYTQDDIVEVARALTGWRHDMYGCGPAVTFNPFFFDDGPKTIFGQTGNWNYDDVHELIFTERATEVAHYICEKLYRYFVYDKPDETVIEAMAQTFLDNNWEISAVMRQLFKSGHFFAERMLNTRIKSPVEVMSGLFTQLGMVYNENFNDGTVDYLTYICQELGQEIFNPVDVAGWPGYHAWLNENTLAFRWRFSADFIYGTFANSDVSRDKLVQLALELADGEISDPVLVTNALTTFFLNQELEPRLLDTAVQYFKGEIPENYFEEGLWNLYFPEAPYQVANLLYYLTRLPEWQLC